ncbi:MAG TPA: glycosyltransferase [Gemmatimonadaceae bacterium]|nr:glycosyltransferase [Gemmatimonadaceae bacterium]
MHSHLRWDFVWQRPQQILSRIARHRPVVFVEEPLFVDDRCDASLQITRPTPGVTRVVPQLPRLYEENADGALSAIRELLARLLVRQRLARECERLVQWFYTPMPAPEMLGAFDEEGVVYDCMDELSQFRFAPSQMSQREKLLLQHADVVFTGGYQLYQMKSRYHDNVHFLGCGVDAPHFAAARQPETIVPADAAALRKPILGYFGVIDERLDYELLSALAARGDWTVLMIGPTVKVDPHTLPALPNIHWLGQRPYADLPSYVKSFDVCLMPFALNEATQYINPTKTLEYMAAGKPIVATAVTDVVRNFSSVVHIAHSTPAFIAEVSEALERPSAERLQAGVELAASQSWESIVAKMMDWMAAAIPALRTTELPGAVTRAARPVRVRSALPTFLADPVAEAS